MLTGIPEMASTIVQRVSEKHGRESTVVAISGIDGSGKTSVTTQIVDQLRAESLGVAVIHLDHWHNPPHVRFSEEQPGEHFYAHAYRFDELFRLLVDPLRKARAIHLSVELTRLPENDNFLHTYDFSEIDVILIEGIFLLKRALMTKYDLGYWVDCSFETALDRAIRRNQEGQSQEEIIRDYERIYFAAQRVHLIADDPKANADGVLSNDDVLSALRRASAS